MASKSLLIILFLPIFLLHLHFSAARNGVRAVYWFPESGLPASDIDSSLFTHLFCAFAQLDTETNQLIIPQENRVSFSQFTENVQRRNPSIRTLLSIGGGSVSSSTFAKMARQASTRRIFIDSSIRLARSNGFHGLDLDWEHQTLASEMADLGRLVQEFRAAIEAEQRGPNVTKLLLTAALAFAPRTNGVDYPVSSLSSSLDWINAMAYDFYAPTRSDVTRSHSALNGPVGEPSGSSGIRAWIRAGVPSNKLVLGFPYYGYAWRLADAAWHDLGAPARGIDVSVPSVDRTEGTIGYRQIRNFIAERSGVRTVFNATIVTDYCYVGTTWIGYDDRQSISRKVAYVRHTRLLGYFAWHIGADNNGELSRQAYQAWRA